MGASKRQLFKSGQVVCVRLRGERSLSRRFDWYLGKIERVESVDTRTGALRYIVAVHVPEIMSRYKKMRSLLLIAVQESSSDDPIWRPDDERALLFARVGSPLFLKDFASDRVLLPRQAYTVAEGDVCAAQFVALFQRVFP